jgi:hypothetical protein
MEQLVLKAVNYFFLIFHISLILFNLFGWIPKRLRKWNLISLGVTAFSWFILGIFYGYGYCFLTDWHWQVRDQLGLFTESESYIQFLIIQLTGITMDEDLVNTFTAIFFFTALALSIYVNIRDRRRKQTAIKKFSGDGNR